MVVEHAMQRLKKKVMGSRRLPRRPETVVVNQILLKQALNRWRLSDPSLGQLDELEDKHTKSQQARDQLSVGDDGCRLVGPAKPVPRASQAAVTEALVSYVEGVRGGRWTEAGVRRAAASGGVKRLKRASSAAAGDVHSVSYKRCTSRVSYYVELAGPGPLRGQVAVVRSFLLAEPPAAETARQLPPLRLAEVRLHPRLPNKWGLQRMDRSSEGEGRLVPLDSIKCKVVAAFRPNSGVVVLMPYSNISKQQ